MESNQTVTQTEEKVAMPPQLKQSKFKLPTYDGLKKLFFNLFVPYGHTTKTQDYAILAFWIVAISVMWTFNTIALIPTPGQVWNEFTRMVSDDGLIAELWESLKLCFISMFFGVIVSTIITYLSSIKIFAPVSQASTKLRYLSISGLSFFFTLLVSSAHLKTYLLVFCMSVFFITSFIEAIATKEDEYMLARTLGLNKWQTFYHNTIRGKLDKLIEITAQTFAILWLMLPSVELLVRSNGGIGVLLTVESKYTRLDGIVAIIILIVVIGVAIDALFGLLKLIITPHTKYENK